MESSDARVAYGDLKVSVRLISPSQELTDFPDLTDLPAYTTVGQVKLLIGNELAIRRRSPLGMRVIYRGRVLDVDEKTLAEVFGIPTIQETSIQVLHLVLRDGGANANASAASHSISQPNQTTQNPFAPRPIPTQPPVPPVAAASYAQYMAPELALDAEFMESTEARQRLHDMAHQERVRELMRQADAQTQQQYVSQQRQQHASTPSVPRDPTYLVEFIDYDQPAAAQAEAERLAFEQLRQIHFVQRQIQTAQTQPERRELAELERQHLLSIQRLEEDQLRNVVEQRRQDRLEQHMQRQAQRPAQPIPQVRVAVTHGLGQNAYPTQTFPFLQQRHVSVLHQGTASEQQHASAVTSGASVGRPPAGRPNVYLLESPSGPRAVLINSNSETYFTPAAAPATRTVPVPQAAPPQVQNEQWYVNLIQQHNLQIQQQQQHYQFIIQQNIRHVEMLHRLQRQQMRHHQMQQQAAYQDAAPQANDAHQVALAGQQDQVPNLHGAGLQPNNPGAGALAAMWPHVWLLARLVLFVWWFTTPSASWTRWATVIMVAIAVFVFNTGVLDEIANQVWAPVRAHLDGFVPMPNANGDARQQEGQNGQNAPGDQNAAVPAPAPANDAAGDAAEADAAGRAGGADPDPFEAAARLVAERRRDNGRRLRDFAQRLERLGVMFLASLAPGIAERHVALAEEREREERRRLQEAAEAAVAAAAEAQAQAEAAAAAAVEASKSSEAPEENTNALQATVEDGDSAAVDAQWRNEEQVENDRAAAQ
ncbi:hypothetical protein SBRCBS47491_004285 [Sporothrix bragantina]|uniref:Ubiquitin-like domain-containing protein n=1 Tax=Sporothrix bragantina TaxID=671064 RepID=A0ABP0BM85_9PEZI